MPRNLWTRSVALLLAAFVAWPALGRERLQCLDGKPRLPLPAKAEAQPAGHDCCLPKPCHVPVQGRCTIESTPASNRALPRAVVPVAPPALLAVLPPVVTAQPQTTPFVIVRAEPHQRPPDHPGPKHGCAPRAPPAFT